MRTLDPTLTINDIVAVFPAAIGPLSARGLDTCCRGKLSLIDAAEAIGVEPEVLTAEILASAEAN
jgi:iron-sulfur cluster repair protein YtfE (RIC family)